MSRNVGGFSARWMSRNVGGLSSTKLCPGKAFLVVSVRKSVPHGTLLWKFHARYDSLKH